MLEPRRIRDQIKALVSGKEEARWEAVRTLKDHERQDWETAPNDIVQPLVEALRQQLPRRNGAPAKLPLHLRRDVAVVLGKIGPRASGSVSALIELLRDDESAAVREVAATALGDIGQKAHTAVGPLLGLLTPDCRVSLAVRVARALGDIGGADSKVRSALTDLWRSTAAASVTQLQVAMALCKLGVEAPGLIGSLVAVGVSGTNAMLRSAAIDALGWCTKNQVGVVPALLAASLEEDENVRKIGGDGLARLGLLPAKAIQICVKQLKDCVQAEVALRRAGAPSVAPLIKALTDSEPVVRERAAKILGAIGEPAVEAVPGLRKTLTDKVSDVRLAAAKALWNITKQPDAVVTALAGLLTGKIFPAPEDAEVRRRFLQSVIEALGRIGPAARAAVPSLVKRGADENRLVRESAVRTLQQIDPGAVAQIRV